MLQSSSKVSGLKASGSQIDKDHCSAFIATGSATRDGKVVMAHNSWLLASAHTGEIMRLELGLKYQNVQRKMDGYFIGYNAPVVCPLMQRSSWQNISSTVIWMVT